MEDATILTASQPRSRHLWWEAGVLVLMDQTLLPGEEKFLRLTTLDEVVEAIYKLRVRGAPAIGIAAAYGVLLAFQEIPPSSIEALKKRFNEARQLLFKARPTAVNLGWALDRMGRAIGRYTGNNPEELMEQLTLEAFSIHAEDIEIGRAHV